MTGRRVGMPFVLSTPTLALRFRQNNGPTPSRDYQPSRSLSMAGSEGDYKSLLPYKELTKTKFTYELSDHLPLWIQLNIDTADQKLDQLLEKRNR